MGGKSDAARCPSDPEALAEAFWMGKLDPVKARQFDGHCAICARCARLSEETREFIKMIRAALAEHPPRMVYRCAPIIFSTFGRDS